MANTNIHLKSSIQTGLFNGMMKHLTDNLYTGDSFIDKLEILFLRKISEEAITIKDNLEGIVLEKSERIPPKAPKMTPIIIRNVYETYIYWKFLSTSSDKNYYSKAYYYEDSLTKEDILYNDFEGDYFFNRINTDADEIYGVKNEWNNITSNNRYPKWYSLKNGPRNFSQMNRWLGMKESFYKIYGFCSKVNHGMGLSNQFISGEDNKIYIDATYNISDDYKNYLFFLTNKLMTMINKDVLNTYKKDVKGLEKVLKDLKQYYLKNLGNNHYVEEIFVEIENSHQ